MPVSRRSSRACAAPGGSTRTQLERPFRGRTALLSPLDRLVFDRKRMAELFEFDYQLEMYKPAAARRWGYWAMPVLHGDRLVGKLDATADPEARGAAGRRAPRGRAADGIHPGRRSGARSVRSQRCSSSRSSSSTLDTPVTRVEGWAAGRSGRGAAAPAVRGMRPGSCQARSTNRATSSIGTTTVHRAAGMLAPHPSAVSTRAGRAAPPRGWCPASTSSPPPTSTPTGSTTPVSTPRAPSASSVSPRATRSVVTISPSHGVRGPIAPP